MIKKITPEKWEEYKKLLPKDHRLYDPPFPASLIYEGKIEASVDFVPPEEILDGVRNWLNGLRIDSFYYFITDGATEDFKDYEMLTTDLNRQNLLQINNRCANLMVGKEFDWAIFIDHEGDIHVAGSRELLDILCEVV